MNAPASPQDPLSEFEERLYREWLPAYCSSRGYDPAGFRPASLTVSAADARGCMRALDAKLVRDLGGGRFATGPMQPIEPLFWEGRRAVIPRPITLWHEPVISFATLARLHDDFGWPAELLVNQPGGWAFDIAGRDPADPKQFHLLVEVKKSRRESDSLVQDLVRASEGDVAGMSVNSRKKWDALLREPPRVVWVVGPDRQSQAFRVSHAVVSGPPRLEPALDDAVLCPLISSSMLEPASPSRCPT